MSSRISNTDISCWLRVKHGRLAEHAKSIFSTYTCTYRVQCAFDMDIMSPVSAYPLFIGHMHQWFQSLIIVPQDSKKLCWRDPTDHFLLLKILQLGSLALSKRPHSTFFLMKIRNLVLVKDTKVSMIEVYHFSSKEKHQGDGPKEWWNTIEKIWTAALWIWHTQSGHLGD